MKEKKSEKKSGRKPGRSPGLIGRRDLLKGLATIPVFGAIAYGIYRKKRLYTKYRDNILEELNISPAPVRLSASVNKDNLIRLGIVGFGIRGRHLLRAAGFAEPQWIEDSRNEAKENRLNTTYEDYMNQEDLNVVINGVCDIFDVHASEGLLAGANKNREGIDGKKGPIPKRFLNYKELVSSPDIDAVIIATPDHWHAPMAIEAAKNGKHVYCEKPMTWSVNETYDMVDAIKKNGVIFQLGHQGIQNDYFSVAKQILDNSVLGRISLIELTTNRNSPNGAWVYPIHPDASPETIDWNQFIGQSPFHEFSLERFFRWRCWWDYSLGISGDLMTHEYDIINQLMNIGIPYSAVSSGGIYYFKDGRTVPDVIQTALEYPEKDLTLLYSATLSSEVRRGTIIMGHDASMEINNGLSVKVEPNSTRFKEKIEKGIINPGVPVYNYIPGQNRIDGVVTPTEQYFAQRGLLYTYRDGKRVDTTFLHIKDWIDSIRSNTQPGCNIDRGFEEAITAHMGAISYRENRKVFWDKDRKIIV
ncbi:MAG: Gfo/Idh/MocA family oxidoreductase [Bacteroidales bacterium]|nr:MAG: Gfo/Idh/MocA family oxidoreductase [Bacteroidales bacterium]